MFTSREEIGAPEKLLVGARMILPDIVYYGLEPDHSRYKYIERKRVAPFKGHHSQF
jgi:hypothetical protein